MSTSLKYWVVLLIAFFSVSVLTLSFVQTRLIRREGWRVFHTRSPVQLYWRELSPLQRWLLWPGVGMFFITWLAAITVIILRHIMGGGTHI